MRRSFDTLDELVAVVEASLDEPGRTMVTTRHLGRDAMVERLRSFAAAQPFALIVWVAPDIPFPHLLIDKLSEESSGSERLDRSRQTSARKFHQADPGSRWMLPGKLGRVAP